MGNINIEISEDLHDDLRIKSIEDKKDIRDIVIEALIKVVKRR